jgi:hypothetical protein
MLNVVMPITFKLSDVGLLIQSHLCLRLELKSSNVTTSLVPIL